MWVKKRHKIVFAFLRPVLKLFLKYKYNIKVEKYRQGKGPYLILSNHQSTLDPFFLAFAFKFPIYFLASDDLFNHKIISPILKYLVAPIPKTKSIKDIQAIKDMIRVLKEGGSVALFPEGNRTYTGKIWEIEKSIVKLVRLSKVPLILYNINGGFGSEPRFGHGVRKGTMTCKVVKTVNPDEYMKMSDEELYELIISTLNVVEVPTPYRFKSKVSAEYLERVTYLCPECNSIGKLRSEGNYLNCLNCGLKLKYTDKLTFEKADEKYKIETVFDWYILQKNYVKSIIKTSGYNDVIFSDDNVYLWKYQKGKVKELVGKGKLITGLFGISFTDNTEHKFNIDEIISTAVVGKNKLNFYVGDITYQIKGDLRYNSLKYFTLIKNIKDSITTNKEEL